MITEFNKAWDTALAVLRRLGRAERTIAGYAEHFRRLVRAHRANGLEALDPEFIDRYDAAVDQMKETVSPGGWAVMRHRRFMRLLRAVAWSDAGDSLEGMALAAGLASDGDDRIGLLPPGLGVHVADFMKWACGRLSPSTFSKYSITVRNFIARLAALGASSLDDLSPASMLKALEGAASASPASARSYVDGPKCFFKWLLACGRTGRDWSECLRIKVPRRVPLIKAFTRSQTDELLAGIPEDREGMMLHAFVTLISETGLRGIDAANLRISDLDWPGRRISLVQSKTRRRVELPITEKLACSLSRYLLDGRPRNASGFVFVSGSGEGRFGQAGIRLLRTRFRELRDRILGPDFEGFGFHSFRRGLGTALFEKDVPVFLISQILGHARVDSSKPYLKADLKHLRQCCLPFPGPVGRKELAND